MRYNHKFLNPFQIIINEEEGYFQVNAGKVYNYYNPLNYSWTSYKGPDGSNLVHLSKEEGSNQRISIEADDQIIEILLLCAFKFPSFWVPSKNFLPDVGKSWIVVRRKKSSPTYTTDSDSITTVSVPYFSPLRAVSGGDKIYNILPAPCLCCVGKIRRLESGDLEVNQLLNSHFPSFSLLDYEDYLFINQRELFNEVELANDGDFPPQTIRRMLGLTSLDLITEGGFTNRGGIITNNTPSPSVSISSNQANLIPFLHNQEENP